ncbi:MAG: peptide chain release factor N(5)-glutamine methyltransferase [Acidimicrobiia bacterium]|nr:peptide chain release factor N(5)-glutamine methyltransferase [Acidimicrobiia bacterium]
MALSVSQLLAEVPDLADHEARRLLQLAAAKGVQFMIGDPTVDAASAARFRQFVIRRRAGEPLQYIEGSVQFGPLQLNIDQRALIPRPETERLWEIAVAAPEQPPTTIVDLCTGSGNLALACKHVFRDAMVVGVDVSSAAVELAKGNATKLGLAVEFYEGDLFDPLPSAIRGRVDLLVANPPYVSGDEAAMLPLEVIGFEPFEALVAGPIGTEILGRIAREAEEWLAPGGVVVCEIGETQGDECRRLFAPFAPRIECDLAGRPRYVLGRAPQRADVH